MKVSIVMASYLGQYKKAALNRDLKIIRAVNSVLHQSYRNIELIIVADGCEKTVEIMKENFCDERIKGYLIEKCIHP